MIVRNRRTRWTRPVRVADQVPAVRPKERGSIRYRNLCFFFLFTSGISKLSCFLGGMKDSFVSKRLSCCVLYFVHVELQILFYECLWYREKTTWWHRLSSGILSRCDSLTLHPLSLFKKASWRTSIVCKLSFLTKSALFVIISTGLLSCLKFALLRMWFAKQSSENSLTDFKPCHVSHPSS